METAITDETSLSVADLGGDTMKIKTLLAFKQKIMREGLRTLLEKYDEFEVAAEADSGESAVALTGEYKPDVVIIDAASTCLPIHFSALPPLFNSLLIVSRCT